MILLKEKLEDIINIFTIFLLPTYSLPELALLAESFNKFSPFVETDN